MPTETEDVTDGRARRWVEHRRARRLALVDAAIEAIEAEGADAGVDAMAARAGVSRTVLYRYFEGREDLQSAVARRAVDLLLEKLTRPLSASPVPRRMIRGVVQAHVRWIDEHPELYRLISTGSTLPVGREAFSEGETVFAARLAAVLEACMTALGVTDDVAAPLAFGLIGLVESTGDWWLRERSMSRRKLVDILADSIWHIIDGHLRARGIELDPDVPLPILVGES
ncbi:TetR/AcrR family transcriptional regulator [Actinocatenispora rupis]|uniref:TetR family transcriptional regulator n=1 Tax=Actinocatenispora rupis TaxID=519421 RepID=A0A8J3J6D0_9ACTN|nr:TetR/AcrR family transcriptional regulator [Actinocatenispora rupis]GID14948.1 TetR family transcriptional regulator [Actinocatenispora rupis]